MARGRGRPRRTGASLAAAPVPQQRTELRLARRRPAGRAGAAQAVTTATATGAARDARARVTLGPRRPWGTFTVSTLPESRRPRDTLIGGEQPGEQPAADRRHAPAARAVLRVTGHQGRGQDGRATPLVPRHAGRPPVVGDPRRPGRDRLARGVVPRPRPPPRLTGDVFGAAPRELVRVVALKQTVDLIQVAVEVLEDHVDAVAEPGDEETLHLAVLQFSREVAFATAQVYASFAENRGAWDARLEALVVDALVRGNGPRSWRDGPPPSGWASDDAGRRPGRRHTTGCRGPSDRPRAGAVIGQRGARRRPRRAAGRRAGRAGGPRLGRRSGSVRSSATGPVVTGPIVDGLNRAGESAAIALAGLRAAGAWPDAPRPVAADALLAERALDGDPLARAALYERVAAPLQAAGGEVLETVRAVLNSGGNLEASARLIFVHPNTVRYRLKRAAELTGLSATDPRGSWTLQVALALARLDQDRSLWH